MNGGKHHLFYHFMFYCSLALDYISRPRDPVLPPFGNVI